MYVVIVLASSLLLVLIFTYFELITDIVRNEVPCHRPDGVPAEPEPIAHLQDNSVAVMLGVLVAFG